MCQQYQNFPILPKGNNQKNGPIDSGIAHTAKKVTDPTTNLGVKRVQNFQFHQYEKSQKW